MALIAWSNQLAVGIEEIDAQHQKLVQLINALHEHMLAGDAADIMGKVLDRVVEYTGFHFSTEERLMAEYGYPQSASHKIEHAKLVHTALDLQAKVHSGHAHVTMETMKFLRNWLQHHIMQSDQSFGKFLQSRNLT